MGINKVFMPRYKNVQEVVIVSGTEFTNREHYRNYQTNHHNSHQHLSLKEACWNGQLKEMMPEIFNDFSKDTTLFLWHMKECNNIFTMELAESPNQIDFSKSIDPYLFMELQEYN